MRRVEIWARSCSLSWVRVWRSDWSVVRRLANGASFLGEAGPMARVWMGRVTSPNAYRDQQRVKGKRVGFRFALLGRGPGIEE